MDGWVERLDAVSRTAESVVCVGLDPDPASMPVDDVFEFNRAIIDATSDLVCAYKPNLAFYEALGLDGMAALQKTVHHIREVAPDVVIVGDAKRGDVGHTDVAYAKAMFEFWDFDAVTVHPYLGRDSVEPFLTYEGRGAIVLCRTSNPGARDLQDRAIDGGEQRLFELVGDLIEQWNERGNVGMLAGATYPREIAALRTAHPTLPVLIPGVGSQGGDVAAAARAGANADGRGMMISSSRGVLYASNDPVHYADAARAAVESLRVEINRALGERQPA